MKIRVVISGRSYDMAQGVPQQLELPEGASLDDAISTLASHLPDGKQLADSCLIAVGGMHVGTLGAHSDSTLKEGDELVVIAPVAGG